MIEQNQSHVDDKESHVDDKESQIEDLPTNVAESDEIKAGGIIHSKPVLAWARVDGPTE